MSRLKKVKDAVQDSPEAGRCWMLSLLLRLLLLLLLLLLLRTTITTYYYYYYCYCHYYCGMARVMCPRAQARTQGWKEGGMDGWTVRWLVAGRAVHMVACSCRIAPRRLMHVTHVMHARYTLSPSPSAHKHMRSHVSYFVCSAKMLRVPWVRGRCSRVWIRDVLPGFRQPNIGS